MNSRTLYSGVGLIIIAGILLLATAIINSLGGGFRIDLTDNDLYSLSEGSKNIVRDTDETVNLYYFFSEKASEDIPQLRNYAQRVEELIQEYVLLSGDKLILHKVDPEPFSEEEDQATAYGLQGVPVNNAGDKLYFGLVAVTDNGDESVIQFFQPDKEEFLEYEVSKLLYQVTHPEPVTIGLISALDINGGFDMMTRQRKPEWMVMAQIKQLFEVEDLAIDSEVIESHIDVLMVIHPKLLSQKTLFAIDQYVLGGGKALVFVDPVAEQDISEMGLMSMDTEKFSDLEQLFTAWGVNYSTEQVLGDARYAMHVNLGAGRRVEPHLGVLSFDREVIDLEDIITAQLETINVSSAGVIGVSEGATTQFIPLITTSNRSMLFDRADFQNMSEPRELFNAFKPTGDYFVVAARVQGPAKTAFPNGPPESEVIEESEHASQTDDQTTELATQPNDVAVATPGGETDNDVPLLTTSDNINVIVVADTDVLSDRLWVQVQQFFGQRIASPWANNATFVINSLDNLGGSADLIKVRSRGRFTRPFTRVDELERNAETRFREQERNLMAALEETEEKLSALNQSSTAEQGGIVELSDEQKVEIAKFEREKLSIRKKLREVQHQLNKDIEALGSRLKAYNVGAVPMVLTLLALGVSIARSRRRAAQ